MKYILRSYERDIEVDTESPNLPMVRTCTRPKGQPNCIAMCPVPSTPIEEILDLDDTEVWTPDALSDLAHTLYDSYYHATNSTIGNKYLKAYRVVIDILSDLRQ